MKNSALPLYGSYMNNFLLWNVKEQSWKTKLVPCTSIVWSKAEMHKLSFYLDTLKLYLSHTQSYTVWHVVKCFFLTALVISRRQADMYRV